jgi:adenylate cyclase
LTRALFSQDDASVGAQPSPDEVRAQMRRILADPALQASPVRRELLRFVVEETLAGRADRLKGFNLALAVFGRKDDFDPQSDPVVRVEARRLRRDLDSYYATAGKSDPILISIPKGGYVPHFAWRDVAPALTPAGSATRPAWHRVGLGLLAAAVLAIAGGLALGPLDSGAWWPDGHQHAATAMPRGPKIAVLPFVSVSDDPQQAYLAEGITDQIVTDLARFKALFVLSPQATARYREHAADPQQLKREFGVDYLLTGSARSDGGQIGLSARLVDAESGRIVWAQSYDEASSPSDVFAVQRDVAHQVSAILASNYGVIAEAGQTEAQHRPSTSADAYDCVLRYYAYQRSLDRQEHAEVRACLERAVELDPDYADAWAVLANVYAQEHRFGYNPRPEQYDSRERSLAAAQRAVEIDPRNPTAQLMLANALFDRGELVQFQNAGERAVELNPNDPEPLVHFGLRLVYVGEWERGLPLVTKAIALNPEHPEWYRDPIIFRHYQNGDYEQALAVAQKQQVVRPWRFLLHAMILGQLGRSEEAKPMIEAELKIRPDLRESFWEMARVWNIPDPAIENMADGLRKAGLTIVPPPPASRL